MRTCDRVQLEGNVLFVTWCENKNVLKKTLFLYLCYRVLLALGEEFE